MIPDLQQIGIQTLSIPERIELIGRIWDSISQVDSKVPIPEWHLRELKRRRAAAEAAPDAGIPWEVVKERLARPK